MSFLTGRYPHTIAQWDNQCQLGSDIPTFAHSFLSGGYETVLAGRMHFVGGDQRHGFERRLVGDVSPTAHITAGWHLDRVLGDLADTPGMSLSGIVKSGPGRTGYQAYDETVARAAADWLLERSTERRFFLTVGLVTPHCPFVSPPADYEAHRDTFTLDDLPLPDENLHPRYAANRVRHGTDPPPPLDAQWRSRVAYYGLTTFMDRQVGSVLDALDASGLAENTIVVYCSDHGELLGEHGLWWKSAFFDGACRVPLIVSLPDVIPQGACRTENVSLIDVGPTLLDLAGVDALPGASGRSFRRLLEGDASDHDDTVIAEDTVGSICRMVRSGSWKYNYYHGMAPELFNLDEDPGETSNLAGRPEYQDLEQGLRERVLRDWDPETVRSSVERLPRERKLVVDWIRSANPPEPDPAWFTDPPENSVDTTDSPDGSRVDRVLGLQRQRQPMKCLQEM
jgi:choline-sulfatase